MSAGPARPRRRRPARRRYRRHAGRLRPGRAALVVVAVRRTERDGARGGGCGGGVAMRGACPSPPGPAHVALSTARRPGPSARGEPGRTPPPDLMATRAQATIRVFLILNQLLLGGRGFLPCARAAPTRPLRRAERAAAAAEQEGRSAVRRSKTASTAAGLVLMVSLRLWSLVPPLRRPGRDFAIIASTIQ
jgi:hypothetical protein